MTYKADLRDMLTVSDVPDISREVQAKYPLLIVAGIKTKELVGVLKSDYIESEANGTQLYYLDKDAELRYVKDMKHHIDTVYKLQHLSDAIVLALVESKGVQRRVTFEDFIDTIGVSECE